MRVELDTAIADVQCNDCGADVCIGDRFGVRDTTKPGDKMQTGLVLCEKCAELESAKDD